VQPARGQVNVIPHGEVDLASAPELDERLRELRESGFDRIVLDLAHVSFMDSTGLRVILDWDETAHRDGLNFELLPGPENVQRLFEITGVLQRLTFARP
jgi:anti-sigma B factor antagonist